MPRFLKKLLLLSRKRGTSSANRTAPSPNPSLDLTHRAGHPPCQASEYAYNQLLKPAAGPLPRRILGRCLATPSSSLSAALAGIVPSGAGSAWARVSSLTVAQAPRGPQGLVRGRRGIRQVSGSSREVAAANQTTLGMDLTTPGTEELPRACPSITRCPCNHPLHGFDGPRGRSGASTRGRSVRR
jgi:hypothetical protein